VSSGLPEHEIRPLLNDFCRRDVLRESRGRYEFVIALFQEWLVQTGINKIVLDSLAEEMESQLKLAEQAAYVTSGEITELVEAWPNYRGRQTTSEDVRAWLQQRGDYQAQRLLFKLLKHLRFFSQQEVREYLRMAHNQMVRPLLPVKVTSKRSERRGDIVVTYLDGPAKSGASYAAKYAEENAIQSSCVIEASSFSTQLIALEKKSDEFPRALVFVDDIVGTGKTLSGGIRNFLGKNKNMILERSLKVVLIVLCATPEGETLVRKTISNLDDVDIDLRICEPLTQTVFPPGEESGWWESKEEKEKAKALCVELGAAIYKDAPLGYGFQGLSVVFPETCPNNSLPILHSSDGRQGGWKPLFQRPVN
jgi:hypothetical protein